MTRRVMAYAIILLACLFLAFGPIILALLGLPVDWWPAPDLGPRLAASPPQ